MLRVLADIGELNVSEIARRAGLNYSTTNARALAKSGCIDIVALGIVSEEEAEETFTIATKAFSN